MSDLRNSRTALLGAAKPHSTSNVGLKDGSKLNYKPVILRTGPLFLLLAITATYIGCLQIAVKRLPHKDRQFVSQAQRILEDFMSGNDSVHDRRARDEPRPMLFVRTNVVQNSTDINTSTAVTKSPTMTIATETYFVAATTVSKPIEPLRFETQTISSKVVKETLVKISHRPSLSSAAPAHVANDATTTISDAVSPAIPEELHAFTGPTLMTLAEPTSPTSVVSKMQNNPEVYATGTKTAEAYLAIDPVVQSQVTDIRYVPTETVVTVLHTQPAPPIALPPLRTTVATDSTDSTLLHTQPAPPIVPPPPTSRPAMDSTLTYVPVDTTLVSTITVKTVVITETVTTVVNAEATSTIPDGSRVTGLSESNDKILVFSWNNWQVFCGWYLAILLAVLYRMIVSVLEYKMSLVDPFRQLCSHRSARADHIFFSFYQNLPFGGPITALWQGRYVLASASAAHLLACIIPPLASEAIWVDTGNYCGREGEAAGEPNPCPARIVSSVPMVRVIQALFGVELALLIVVMSSLRRKKTGLVADPSSIASISSLLRYSSETGTNELADLLADPNIRLGMKKVAIAKQKHALGFPPQEAEGGYGLYCAPPENDEGSHGVFLSSSRRGNKEWPVRQKNHPNKVSRGIHLRRRLDILALFLTTGTFAAVTAYYLDRSNSGFNRFFNSDTFGPRFILAGAAISIASIWSEIQLQAVVLAPLVQLSRRQSSSCGPILFEPSNTPVFSIWRTLREGYYVAAATCVASLLSNVLGVVIVGVPFARGQVYSQLEYSAAFSIAILGFMMLVLIWVIVHRRHEPSLPVVPDTLAAKVAYLGGARMLEDFDPLESRADTVARLHQLGKRYRFGPHDIDDGSLRWLVDEVQDDEGKDDRSSASLLSADTAYDPGFLDISLSEPFHCEFPQLLQPRTGPVKGQKSTQ